MKLFFKLMRESFVFAYTELLLNKTRTFLSLLGISIGIFAIISVFTIFDSLEINIRSSLDSMGSDVLYVQKWPWSTSHSYPWWKYINRPQPSISDFKAIENNSEHTAAVAFMLNINKSLKYQNNSIAKSDITGVSYQYAQMMALDIEKGRYFSAFEAERGSHVAVIGSKIAKDLFPNTEMVVGKTCKIGGVKTHIIGVLRTEGANNFIGNDNDGAVFVPLRFAQSFVDIKRTNNNILVQAKPHITNKELSGEIRAILRAAHRLSPKQDDDFAINEMSIVSNVFDQLFGILATVGWVIGGFSLLVGGFGVANIMFISVKERTRIIGIQKAIGAKNYFILFQFLFESVFLSLLGGLLGLILVLGVVLLMRVAADFPAILTLKNILLGLGVSSLIGLLSGLMPSMRAAKLDPVEAMRANA